MPAVTIGLPFRDARDTLADAVRSVFAQTYEDWELLLVDDGSTDGSLEMARSIRHDRVRVLSDGRRLRLPARLNQIVDEARGAWIARLDADDAMHPERLARQMAVLGREPSLDLVGTACFTWRGGDEVMGVVASDPMRADPRHVLRRGLLPHATLVCRRGWCLAHRYDERFPRAEDRELFCRALNDTRAAHVQDPLYFVGYRKAPRRALRDSVATYRDNRRILLEHGPAMVGLLGVVPLLAESFMKEAVYRVGTALGLQPWLFARRGRPPTAAESRGAIEALRHIRATHVEGLDGAKEYASPAGPAGRDGPRARHDDAAVQDDDSVRRGQKLR